MKRVLIFLPVVLLMAGAVGDIRAATAPDTFSPVVSYQYGDSLDEPDTSTKVSSPVVSYQFQDSMDEADTSTTATSPVVSYQYFESLESDNATITNSLNVSYFLAGGLQIITPPVLGAVLAGSNASFTVAASGTPAPTYQWQVSTDGGKTWTNVSGSAYAGATTATLTITNPSLALLGYQYRAAVTNTAGTINTAAAPLIVGTSTAKLAWFQNYFTPDQLVDPSVVDDLATPANDGIANIIKYAFNLNPFQPGQDSLPAPQIASGELTLTFPLPPSDVAYTVEASTDLVNWSTNGVTTQTNGPQVTASYTLSGNTPVFLQIVISPAP